jgi:YggT family protein
MRVAGEVVYWIGWIFVLLLFFRMVMSWVLAFARGYTPHGAMLIATESAYTVTDPPINLVRRFVPPLRIGGVAIDLSVTIVLLFVWVVVLQLLAGTLLAQ